MLFNRQQFVGAKIAPQKKTTLLVEESPCNAEIEENISGRKFTHLLYYPEVQMDPDFDYSEDCYDSRFVRYNLGRTTINSGRMM